MERKQQRVTVGNKQQNGALKDARNSAAMLKTVRGNWTHLHNKLLKRSRIFTYDEMLPQRKLLSLSDPFKTVNLNNRLHT
jgi:hypothetical protein